MGTWEYRIVRNKEVEIEYGEGSYELKEVYLDENDLPWSYGDPCLMSDTPEGMAQVMSWIADGAAKPALVYPDDFKGMPPYSDEGEDADT